METSAQEFLPVPFDILMMCLSTPLCLRYQGNWFSFLRPLYETFTKQLAVIPVQCAKGWRILAPSLRWPRGFWLIPCSSHCGGAPEQWVGAWEEKRPRATFCLESPYKILLHWPDLTQISMFLWGFLYVPYRVTYTPKPPPPTQFLSASIFHFPSYL